MYKLNFLIVISIFFSNVLKAQQFNSDNYLVMPHGIATTILTTGERNATFAASLALIPKFEFAFSGNLFWDDISNKIPQHFTTSLYTKYSVWVNKNKNGGLAAFLGLGRSPSYFTSTEFVDLEKNYWTAISLTLPLFNNKLSLDFYPGAMLNIDYKKNKESAWGFTYSTRLTINEIIPKLNLVAEIYGTEGKAYSNPEFKAGLQWVPNDFIVPALTFGSQLNGISGAGFEIGVFILSPPFLKKDYLKSHKIEY